MTPATKTRAPRLRASCDGCFLAKVKCSKTRPMCARCLSSGVLCHYSPSSRAGKPKPDNNHSPRASPAHHHQPIRQPMPMLPGGNAMSYLPQTTADQLFPLEGTWGIPSTGDDGTMGRNPALASNMPLFGLDESTLARLDPISAAHPEFSSSQPLWEHGTNIPITTFPDGSAAGTQMSFAQALPFDQSLPFDQPMPTWIDQNVGIDQKPDMVLYPQANTSPSLNYNYLPSPNTTPIVQSTLYHHPNGGTCQCFAACLHSLLELHNASAQTPTPFEVVLNINDKAVNGCVTMTACKTCFHQSGADTSAMLIATIFSKIASSYKDAAHSNCGFDVMRMPETTPNGSMSGGTYPPNEEENQSRINYLDGALQKFHGVFSEFCRHCDSATMMSFITNITQNIKSCQELIFLARAKNDTNLFGTTTWDNVKEEA